MSDPLDRVLATPDPFDRLRLSTEEMAAAQVAVTELARLRRQLVTDLREAGYTYAEIAAKAGLTRGRIHQIRTAGPAAEGAFLGRGAVTIATPMKQESIRRRPVVAAEDVAIANQLADLARSLSLDPSIEQIPLDGRIDLNRPNLIVLCGPRLSTTVAELLAQDPAIGFEQASDGPWTLVDRTTGQRYRSGQDSDPPRPYDVGYLARLPRPDRAGSVLVFTGIHPQGSLGIAQLLADELAGLYAETGTREFSMIVGTDYDPDTGEPHRVERLTGLYQHEDG